MDIDKLEFKSWMQRVMQRFDMITELLQEKQIQKPTIEGDELLDSADVLQMLKISSRSLQRYRSTGRLPYYSISGKVYYKLSDIHQLIRENFKTPVAISKTTFSK